MRPFKFQIISGLIFGVIFLVVAAVADTTTRARLVIAGLGVLMIAINVARIFFERGRQRR